MEFYAHPRSSLTIFCSVDVWHPPQTPLQHVGRGAPTPTKVPAKMPLPVYLQGAGTARHHTYIAYSQKKCAEAPVFFKGSKKTPCSFLQGVCGAPYRSKLEHFCLSRRHRYHTAAHPEVMPVVPPREDKRGVLKYQGAFAASPRSTNWAVVFHSSLDISPSLFFGLIAE